MAQDQTTVDVEGHRLNLSNLDKVLFPSTGTTKAELLSYYTQIAPVLLPHLARRPVTLVRAPDGTKGGSFFEKNVPRGAPKWFHSIPVSTRASSRAGKAPGKGETIDYPAIDGLPALIWVANLAAIELHVPMWKVDAKRRPRPPDLLVFDLDPGEGTTVNHCAVVAQLLHASLEEDGLSPLPKASGSKGLQLYSHWDRGAEPVDTLTYARRLAHSLERRHGDLVVSNMRKDLRRGRVLIDWSQNNTSKTTVAPYSVRLREVPSVSCPISWAEVDELADGAAPESVRFLPDDVLARVGRTGDLFEPLLSG